MEEMMKDGVRYSALQVSELRSEWLETFRQKNKSDLVEKSLEKDKMYEKYKKGIDDFLAHCGYNVINDHVFGKDVGKNIALAKKLRNEGKSPWFGDPAYDAVGKMQGAIEKCTNI